MNLSKKVLVSVAAMSLVSALSITAFASELQVKSDTFKYQGVKVETPVITGARGGEAVDRIVNLDLQRNAFNTLLGYVSTKESPKPLTEADYDAKTPTVAKGSENLKQVVQFLGDRLVKDQTKAGQSKPYSVDIEYEIESNKIYNRLSVLQEVKAYTGGAHANKSYLTSNYNLYTGKKIALSEVFMPGSDYKARLLGLMKIYAKSVQRITNESAKAAGLKVEEGYYVPKAITGNEKYYMDGSRLTIIYNPGEIAPITEGKREFKFATGTIGDILNFNLAKK